MSAPVRMTPAEVTDLGGFLHALSKATKIYGANVCAYGPIPVRISAVAVLSIDWDGEAEEYVVDDRAGQ